LEFILLKSANVPLNEVTPSHSVQSVQVCLEWFFITAFGFTIWTVIKPEILLKSHTNKQKWIIDDICRPEKLRAQMRRGDRIERA
jgi:hypothetical protein